ncbi:replication protein [Alkaliphilus sp. B6464]|uniref:replication protein n=1 Tax=Alkaliphilus sp. B6464 TaxID=2731219 RepID=UPI001BA5C611|nr:replication protein [Alkaliphilus sp. B6464]QUH21452.1 replication protein [Alkaliphilus sp. B6464]
MANPQLENGYTRIANELLEVIYSTKFNATQLKILLCIIRYTYGFGRKEHELSLSFISKATGVSRRYVSSELNKLIESNVVLVSKKYTDIESRKLMINKKYQTWVGCGTIVQQVKNCSTDEELFNTPDEELFNTPVEESFYQERKIKEIYKENIKERVFETYNNQNIITHKELTSKMKQAIDKALKRDKQDTILEAIKRYGEAFRDPNYQFCKYKMTLDKFLTQNNGYYDWLDEGQKWINYSDFKSKGPSQQVVPQQRNQPPKPKTKFHLAKSRGDKYSADELEQLILNNQKKRREGN